MIERLPVRVALMDDDFAARKHISNILTRDPRTTVCLEAGTPEALLADLATTRAVDLIVVDAEYRWSGDHDLASFIHSLHAQAPTAQVLCLSQYGDALMVEAALSAGVCGVVLKEDLQIALVPAVIRTRRQAFIYTQSVADHIQRLAPRLARAGQLLPNWAPNPRLTARQVDLLWMQVMYRMRARAIAEEWSVAPSTPPEYMKGTLGALRDDLTVLQGWAEQDDFVGLNLDALKAEDLAFVVFTALPRINRRRAPTSSVARIGLMG